MSKTVARIAVAEPFAVEAEGHRIGLTFCPQCGAALLLTPEADTVALHTLWHAELKGHKHLFDGPHSVAMTGAPVRILPPPVLAEEVDDAAP